ncbi:hypothetical protein F5X68DRAFT_250458 [Plectosphaerella plurivora]|uniref:Fumarylacetoacetase-like C-terminal domain-containing protein n=1 Tax=Plectosphaerella plurivora TaxID=936078 RepID=A0A9P8VG61_9PEZI|nr:hypothetical protein F5X68DRAFT_250458 [Plectosphaerella plurivora]
MSITPVWDRLVRFVSTDGRVLCGQPIDPDVDVGLALASGQPLEAQVLSGASALDDADFTGEVAIIQKLLSPISASEVGTIRCIGMNYRDHAAELNLPIPKVPEVFMKPSNCLHNPSDPVILPQSASDAVDAEVELAVVIGRDCKDVAAEDALDYVLGYTVANDITARDVQSQILQWGYCKGYDGFCPLGPALVSARALPDPSVLALKTTLDGQTLQDGSASDMIFTVPEIIEYLSRDTTLPKGTVILTGTPSGIGHSYQPPRYMKEGSNLRISITPGLGTLTNAIASGAKGAKTQPRL